MRPVDPGEKFPRCSFSYDTCQSSQQVWDPELGLWVKAISQGQVASLLVSPVELVQSLMGFTAGPKTVFHVTPGSPLNCQAIATANAVFGKIS